MQKQELETIRLDDADSALILLDQTELPNRVVYLRLYTTEEIREAICALRVRGAPAIGVAAAAGLYLAAKHAAQEESLFDVFRKRVAEAKELLASARPTAVNLSWALERVYAELASSDDKRPPLRLPKICEEPMKRFGKRISACVKRLDITDSSSFTREMAS